MSMVLQTSSLRKEFGTLVAVNDVNIELKKGQVLGLIGPNGAGKTTLLRMLATLLRPTSGSITVLDKDVKKQYLSVRKHIGYMPDFFSLYKDLTLQECLEFFAHAYEVDKSIVPDKIHQALGFVGLESKKDTFIRHLSRGMMQRVGVATLLVRDPDVLLLDEPASGLDPISRIQLKEILIRLGQEGKAVIVSSHILTELSGFCSHIAIMNKGKVVLYGNCDEIQAKITDSRTVQITTAQSPDAALSYLKGLPHVNVKTVNNNTIIVEMVCDDNALADLNAYLVNKDIKVIGFAEQKMNLEDVFMAISKQ